MNFRYPEQKDFVFTIFDDTDVAVLDYVKPVYEKLAELKIFTTKSVWPMAYRYPSNYAGSHTLQDSEYAAFIRDLHERGFEIGYHGPTMESSTRELVIKSFDVFHNCLGFYPRIYAPHSINRENLYWGPSRLSNPLLRMVTKFLSKRKGYYQGHVESSPYFWGDLSLKYIDYVRNLAFNDINLLNVGLSLPYHNPQQPFVNNWFFSSYVDNVEEFNRFLNEDNLSKLEKQRGICILSTHFGKGFIKDGKLHPRTAILLEQLSEKNGWFAPVSRVLDFLKSLRPATCIIQDELIRLEAIFLLHSITRHLRRLPYEKTEIPYLERQL